MKLSTIKAAQGFVYDNSPQGSPEWLNVRLGKVTASRLGDWLSVSKRDGKPLKARTDYERELAYERQFGTSFERFVTSAMQMGIDYEDFVAEQYAELTGNKVAKCGAFVGDLFVASPDRLTGDDGLLEIKVMGDASFADVLLNGVPSNYYLQVQGQLLASGRAWADFAVANLKTGKLKVIRVERDDTTIQQIADSLTELSDITVYSEDGLYDFSQPAFVGTEDKEEGVVFDADW